MREAAAFVFNLAISRIVTEALECLRMKFPKPTVDIDAIWRKYHAEEEKEEQAGGKKDRKPRKNKKSGKSRQA